jgi:hypothetical protein
MSVFVLKTKEVPDSGWGPCGSTDPFVRDTDRIQVRPMRDTDKIQVRSSP